MAREQLKFGGYVQYPLAPKDVKAIDAMLPDFDNPEKVLTEMLFLSEADMGIKIESQDDHAGFKVVLYNQTPFSDEDDHVYYISGESKTLAKALAAAIYKFRQCSKDGLSKWTSVRPKGEYR